MDAVLLIAGVLVIAFLLYLGNRARERRRAEVERERHKALEQAEGHRSMATDHEHKAEELREAAEAEEHRAERHQARAAQVDPDADE
jgi:hypothetical protein